MTIIGIGHKARQGKDFASKYMQHAMPSMIKLYSFARALKEYCRDNHDTLLPRWQLANQTKGVPEQKDDPIYGYTRILQWYGTLARETNENVWVEKVAAQIESDNPDIAIVTDVRFPNEAAFVKEKGGYTVECIRRNADGSQYQDPGRDPYHVSETALDNYDWDFTIMVRDGDLQSLKSKSEGVLRDIVREEAVKESASWFADTSEEAFDGLEEQPVPDATGFPL